MEFVKNGYGKTGKRRWKCLTCGTTFSTNWKNERCYHDKPHLNKRVFEEIVNRTPFSGICRQLSITPTTLYQKIDFLQRQCLRYAASKEKKMLEGKVHFKELHISVDEQHYSINWKSRKDRKNVVLYGISSADNRSGFVFGSHVNFDSGVTSEDVEVKAFLCGDYKKEPPVRKYARYWLVRDYKEYSRKTPKIYSEKSFHTEEMDKEWDHVVETAQREGKTIYMVDENDVEWKLPDEGVLIHSEYSLQAHFFFLKKLLDNNFDKVFFYLDNADFISRNACLIAFQKEVLEEKCDAFFVKINKDMKIDERDTRISKSKRRLQEFMENHPDMKETEAKLAIIKNSIDINRNPKEVREGTSDWDGWIFHPFARRDEPEKEIRYLNDNGTKSNKEVAQMMLHASIYGVETYYQQIHRLLSPMERSLNTASSFGRRWSGFSPYNPSVVQKLLDIFRIYHNYVMIKSSDRRKPKGKRRTPAMIMGLTYAPAKIEDIIYFENTQEGVDENEICEFGF